MTEPLLSVVIITRARPELLSACLASVAASRREGMEVLVGINGPEEVSSEAAGRFPDVRTVPLPGFCRGEARNAVAAEARGRWLCFLDDDTVVPAGYFDRLFSLIRDNPEASVFGGGQELAPGSGFFEELVYRVLGSAWGGGPFTERFSPVSGTRRAGPEKFILCNLVLDRNFISGRGLVFEGHLSSAEENLLLSRMAAAGAVMVLSGGLNLVHRRRKSLRRFMLQVFSSGRGRAQISAISAGAAAPFTLLPPAAALAALLAALLSIRSFSVLSGLYLLISAVAAARLEAGWRLKAAAAGLFPVLHCSYACGWFFGAAESALERFRGGAPARCACRSDSGAGQESQRP